MNKDLKNRGVNGMVIAISVIIVGVLIGSAFVSGNEIYDAPLLSKVLGYGFIVAGCVWAAKSESWLSDVIESDRVLIWAQILGTIAGIAIGMTILVV